MTLLRSIKSEYEFYYNQKLDGIVALDAENQKALSLFWKSNKGKGKRLSSSFRLTGFKMIKDEEFQSLKIDFSQSFQFDAMDLIKAKLS